MNSTTTSGPAVVLYSAPASEPITAALVKAAATVDSDVTAWDDLIAMGIAAARQQAEHITGRKLITQTWDVLLDAFPTDEILLPLTPVQSITAITYADADGVTQTLADSVYLLDKNDDTRPFVLLAADQVWPDTYDTANAVRIRVVCGYGANASDVPAAVRQWMTVQVASTVPGSDVKPSEFVDRLLDGVKVYAA